MKCKTFSKGEDEVTLFENLLPKAQSKPIKTVALACPENAAVIEMITAALKLKMANFILFGNLNKINEILPSIPKEIKIVNCADKAAACQAAVQAVSAKKADILMKGMVDTSVILKHVLNRDYGLRTGKLLSHIMVCYLMHLDRLVLLSDGGLNIDPDPSELSEITINAIELAHSLGIAVPKAALLSAVEKVNPKIPSTVKCQEAVETITRGGIQNCCVAGPLALDIALCKEAAEIKNITNPVAGAADILIVPYIEVANVLYKGWMFGCDGNDAAGIIVGAKAPIILTSRADNQKTKLYSLALAILALNGGTDER